MILADSNLIIYAAAQDTALMDWFAINKPIVSAFSLVEVLGYHKLTLATHNTGDFTWIESLSLIDPLV